MLVLVCYFVAPYGLMLLRLDATRQSFLGLSELFACELSRDPAAPGPKTFKRLARYLAGSCVPMLDKPVPADARAAVDLPPDADLSALVLSGASRALKAIHAIRESVSSVAAGADPAAAVAKSNSPVDDFLAASNHMGRFMFAEVKLSRAGTGSAGARLDLSIPSLLADAAVTETGRLASLANILLRHIVVWGDTSSQASEEPSAATSKPGRKDSSSATAASVMAYASGALSGKHASSFERKTPGDAVLLDAVGLGPQLHAAPAASSPLASHEQL